MCYKLFLLSTLMSLLISPFSMAENECTKEAIEQANNQYLQEMASQMSLFANQQNHSAVTELNNIKPTTSFKKKYAREINQLNTPNYQPSQEFCDDVYANLEELKSQLSDVINKYSLKETP